MLLAVVVVIMILKVVSVVILLKVFIAFCNIRGGGRGSGGVILYEKIATEKKEVLDIAGSYRGVSATSCREHCNVSATNSVACNFAENQ